MQVGKKQMFDLLSGKKKMGGKKAITYNMSSL